MRREEEGKVTVRILVEPLEPLESEAPSDT